jgi:hypothetical protein
MLAFYVYVFLSGRNPPKKIKSEGSYWEQHHQFHKQTQQTYVYSLGYY